MNLLLLEPNEIQSNGEASIQGPRAEHVFNIHRALPGDNIRVGQVGGLIGHAKVLTSSKTDLSLGDICLNQQPPTALPLCLVLALPRPKMLRRIIRLIAELGIKELHIIHSYRVEKSYWQTPVLEPDQIQALLRQGLEQAKDTILPTVSLHRRFKPFVEDQLKNLCNDRQAILAHPATPEHPNCAPCPQGLDLPSCVVIGPEGGFIPYEVDLIKSQGFEQVHLGPRIYRVEHVIPILAAKLYHVS